MHKLSLYYSIFNKSHIYFIQVILYIIFNLFSHECTAQMTFSVSQPRLKIANDSLIITYDILGVKTGDKFYIWLEITDSTGKEIDANTLKGDIGDNIIAGANKQIIWNLIADEIFINNTVDVEIIAEKIIIPEPETETKDMSEKPSDIIRKEDITEIAESKEVTNKPETTYTKVKVGRQFLKSAIFPGWGSTSLSNGKPFWILGVAGMGCIASSVYFDQSAHSSYHDYLNSSDDDITGYYDDAIKQGDISKIFAMSAAAIWIVDMGIVTIKASSINKSYRKNRLSSFSINPRIDSITDTPMLTLQYKF